MAKEIRLNAFEMNCVAHQSPGLWRHRGIGRGIIAASIIGPASQRRSNGACSTASSSQTSSASTTSTAARPTPPCATPRRSPSTIRVLIVPAMANVTRHLGFGVTATLSYEAPFPFARRMSTLDHLTEGRIGWNVVTGYLDSAARALGRTGQNAHDDRYAIADDYMEVVYKLWEGSWAEDAVIADAESGVFTRPDGVRRVSHTSAHHRLDAIHLSEPSPQRTPVIYQAGTSRPQGAPSPAVTRNASSCRVRRRRSSRRASPPCAPAAAAAGAIRPRSASSP